MSQLKILITLTIKASYLSKQYLPNSSKTFANYRNLFSRLREAQQMSIFIVSAGLYAMSQQYMILSLRWSKGCITLFINKLAGLLFLFKTLQSTNYFALTSTVSLDCFTPLMAYNLMIVCSLMSIKCTTLRRISCSFFYGPF